MTLRRCTKTCHPGRPGQQPPPPPPHMCALQACGLEGKWIPREAGRALSLLGTPVPHGKRGDGAFFSLHWSSPWLRMKMLRPLTFPPCAGSREAAALLVCCSHAKPRPHFCSSSPLTCPSSFFLFSLPFSYSHLCARAQPLRALPSSSGTGWSGPKLGPGRQVAHSPSAVRAWKPL